MSWFRNSNINAQAQINAAVSLGQTVEQEKNNEIERLKNEARLAQIRSTVDDSDDGFAERMAMLESKKAKESLAATERELIIAKNALQDSMVDIETFKRLAIKLGNKCGDTEAEILRQFGEIKKDVKDELNLTPTPVPEPIETPVIPHIPADYSKCYEPIKWNK